MPTSDSGAPNSALYREIRAVTFDLDGLMFNTEDLYDRVLDEMLRPRGQEFSLSLKLKMMGLPGPQAAAVMIEQCGLDESPKQLLDEAHRRLGELLPSEMRPMPGLLPLLDSIEQAGLPKSIATSSSPEFARRALEISGLIDRFLFVLTAEDVVRGKPHPDVYLLSAKKHNVEPGNLLVFEDSVTGSRAAASAGTIAVAIPGHHSAGLDFSHVTFQYGSLEAPEVLAMVNARQVEGPFGPG